MTFLGISRPLKARVGRRSKKSRRDYVYVWPQPGAYVVVAIDPVATLVKFGVSQDVDELHLAVEKLAFAKYVAMIEPLKQSSDIPPAAAGRTLPFNLRFVLRGPPTGFSGAGSQPPITPSMTVPIEPNATHPTGRQPIHLSKMLPWDDCYHSSFVNPTALCQPIVMPLTLSFDGCISKPLGPEHMAGGVERARMRMFTLGDRETSKQLWNNVRVKRDEELPINEQRAYDKLDVMPVVRLSYDLSEVNEVVNPKGFFDEAVCLHRVAEETKSKVVEPHRARKAEGWRLRPRCIKRQRNFSLSSAFTRLRRSLKHVKFALSPKIRTRF